jgi:16S rRNA (cytidine1402-2'-O)-methyltransferase
LTLYLLPNVLDESLPHEPFLPSSVGEAVRTLRGLIAESEKGARRYLRRFVDHDHMARLPLRLLNEHTKPGELADLLAPILSGEIWGLVSDAGLPCLADPGAPLVRLAREKHCRIIALCGPSSPILALQLSGLGGQRFAFHGYLPKSEPELRQKLAALEKSSRQDLATQIWIEAPYRSGRMAQIVIETLQSETLLCIARNLTSPGESVQTLRIREWRKQQIHIEKDPSIFLIESDFSLTSNPR